MSEPRLDERGETLIELVVAITIMSIGAVAILAGFQFSVLSSDVGRKESNGDAYARSAAEAIQNSVNAGLASCSTAAGSYAATGQSAVNAAGGSGYTVAVSSPVTWNSTQQAWSSTCSANESQRINVSVTSPGTGAHSATEQLTVVLLRPCSGALPSPC